MRGWILVTAALVIGLATGYLLLSTPQGGMESMDQASPDGIQIALYIYKNGELVYYDPNDPPTKNFMIYIANVLAGKDLAGNGVDINGNQKAVYDVTGYGYIFASASTTSYLYTMYSLPDSRWEAQIQSGDVVFLDANKTLVIAGNVIFDTNTTIQSVGLYSSLYYGTFLMLYDVLSSPVQVNTGDALTIVYRITAP